jgi:putative tricarboxylic transport membrane protein
MDIFSGLLSGFQIVFQPVNFLYCFIGVFIGTLIGVLPGIGPTGAMAMLLPTTFGLSPVSSLIMLAGIFYGAQYGGSTTSILVNIPGEASSIVTTLDGYQMARQGRAGPALGIAAFGSLIGGTFSVIGLMFLALPLAEIAVAFGPPEYFSLICLTMILSVYLSRGSLFKSFTMIIIGLILSTVGMDPISGKTRFTFGCGTLINLEESLDRVIFKAKIKNLLPDLEDWKKSIGPITRGTLLGFPLGVLPGGGAIIASFVSYSLEKKISKTPERFGQGAIEGVAGPETANNAAAGGSFIPLLALGIPPNVVMAILMGALIINGITPGPLMLKQYPEVFWGVVASMYLGNIILLLLNLPLIGLWVKLLKVPYRILMPLILLFCLIGSYSLNNNVVEVVIMIVFGVAGYVLRKFEFEVAPLMVAFILGPIWENSWRQSLVMSDGKFSIFLEKPISLVTLALATLVIMNAFIKYYRKRKKRFIFE